MNTINEGRKTEDQELFLTDQEVENLISASFERQDMLAEIDREVMEEVKRNTRRETLRQWIRIAAFSFGVPFVLFCFGFGTYYAYTRVEMYPYLWIAFALPAIAILVFLGKQVINFSISEV